MSATPAPAATGKHRLFRRRGGDGGSAHESPVTYIELFFDLVFVFAITQLSHRLLGHLTPLGALETLLLFCAVWWAWVYTSWSTNWLDPERGAVRILLIALMLAGLALSAAVPDAFGDDGLLFAAAYLTIQIGRTGFMIWAFWGVRNAGARNFTRITAYFLLSLPLWLWGASVSGEARLIAWTLALAIEYAGPFAFFRFPGLGRSTGDDWDISGSHMAERCALFVIIALGEAILVTGATFAGLDRDAPTTTAFVISFLGSAAMWWVYFDIGAKRASALMETSAQAGLLARNAYTYLHMPIVGAIIVTAVGDEMLLAHPHGPVGLAMVLTVVGGPWLFLLGNMGFKWITGDLRFPPLSHGVGMTLLLALGGYALVVGIDALLLGGLASACLIVTATWEWFSLNGGWQRWLAGRSPAERTD